jgi:Sec-independent protein translocase protein TatA
MFNEMHNTQLIIIIIIIILIWFNGSLRSFLMRLWRSDRLCGLMVRVPGF